MKNGSMFQNLHLFEDPEFFDENQMVYIYTPDHVYSYQIFAAYKYDDRNILKSFDFSDKEVFAEALNATAAHRGTAEQIANVPNILQNIEESPELKTMWDKYRKQFAYAKEIEYMSIMTVLRQLLL